MTSDKCVNWTTALTKCRQENSVLVDVANDEENVYIQHRYSGEKSWLGLNDISMEGNFTWADRGEGNFTAWAKNQPNNLNEEDCVHAIGVKYNYKWNDVKCSDCHRYTCKKGRGKLSAILVVFVNYHKFYIIRHCQKSSSTDNQRVNDIFKFTNGQRKRFLVNLFILICQTFGIPYRSFFGF